MNCSGFNVHDTKALHMRDSWRQNSDTTGSTLPRKT